LKFGGGPLRPDAIGKSGGQYRPFLRAGKKQGIESRGALLAAKFPVKQGKNREFALNAD